MKEPPYRTFLLDACTEGHYRTDGMQKCEACADGKEANSERTSCGMFPVTVFERVAFVTLL